jgi:hypothetical protein
MTSNLAAYPQPDERSATLSRVGPSRFQGRQVAQIANALIAGRKTVG